MRTVPYFLSCSKIIASAEYPAACRGDEGVGNEAVYKNLKDTLRLAAGNFIS